MQSLSFKIPYTVMGPGAAGRIGEIAKDLGATKALIVTDAGVVQAGLLDKIKPSLDQAGLKYDVFDRVEANAQSRAIEECIQKAAAGGYDLLIGVGGGSTMDTTKVTSLTVPNSLKVQDLLPPGKPIKKTLLKILVPTTAGTGSEWSCLLTFTDAADGLKKVLRYNQFWSDATIIDPEMTLNLPQNVTAETGMDVLAHSIEGYVSAGSGGLGDMFCEAAIKMAARNIRLAYGKGSKHMEARYNMAVAAALAMKGAEINETGLGHFIDSFVVSKFHISHGAALAIVVPHVMKFNLVAVPDRYAKVAEWMGEQVSGLPVTEAAEKAIVAWKRLTQDMGMKQTLSEIGMKESDIPQLVDDLFRLKQRIIDLFNPRTATKADVTKILKAAM
jgi:alcohol dehydrogenase class IV